MFVLLKQAGLGTVETNPKLKTVSIACGLDQLSRPPTAVPIIL